MQQRARGVLEGAEREARDHVTQVVPLQVEAREADEHCERERRAEHEEVRCGLHA